MRIPVFCLSVLMVGPALRAQSLFVVYEDNAQRVVRAVHYGHPYVEVDKKLRSATGARYGVQKAAIYSPACVTIAHEHVVVRHVEFVDAVGSLNYDMRFMAELTSDRDLENCFVVLELAYAAGTGVVFEELPNLRAGKMASIDFVFQLAEPVGEGHYTLHLFANGLELLTSKIEPAEIAAQRARTEEFMLRGQPDRNVVASHMVIPIYPHELEAERLVGSATVRCHIDTSGKLVETRVVAATHPAFGEAALAAVRQWQFGPAVKDHHYVESTIEIPFDFKAPSLKEAK